MRLWILGKVNFVMPANWSPENNVFVAFCLSFFKNDANLAETFEFAI